MGGGAEPWVWKKPIFVLDSETFIWRAIGRPCSQIRCFWWRMGGWELTSAFTTNGDVRRRGSPTITSDKTWPMLDWYRTEIDPCSPVVNWFGGLDIPGIDRGAGVGMLLWSMSGTSEMSSDIDS